MAENKNAKRTNCGMLITDIMQTPPIDITFHVPQKDSEYPHFLKQLNIPVQIGFNIESLICNGEVVWLISDKAI